MLVLIAILPEVCLNKPNSLKEQTEEREASKVTTDVSYLKHFNITKLWKLDDFSCTTLDSEMCLKVPS